MGRYQRLVRLTGRQAPWWRPVLVDGALAAFLLLVSTPLAVRRDHLVVIPLLLALIAPLALRRRYPVQVFVVVALAAFVQRVVVLSLGTYDFAVLIALYSVAAYRSRRWSLSALAVGLLGVVLAWTAANADRHVSPFGLVAPTVVVVAVWLVGRTIRTRRGYLAELEQRAVRLERERDALARAAVAEERARIAREMHDIVAHTVAVMVAQAEGAGVAVRAAPDAAEHALEVISDAGRSALSELRRMLGVLRDESTAAGTQPQPGLADLDALVVSMRSSGLPVRFVREGQDGPLEPALELAVYRIVQESLTNTLKHAGPQTPTRLLYRQTAETVEVDVLDRGTQPDRVTPDGHGHGLTGIRERVTMFDGRFRAGPTPTGGWRVQVLLPLPVPAVIPAVIPAVVPGPPPPAVSGVAS